MPLLLVLDGPFATGTDATATPSGLSASLALGTPAEAVAAIPSGLALAASLTAATPGVTTAPSGLSAIAVAGAVTEAVAAAPGALAGTVALGTVTPAVTTAPAGGAVVAVLAAPTATGDAVAIPVGLSCVAQVGTALESVAATPSTPPLSIALGNVESAVEVMPPGQAAVLTLGSVTATGDAVDALATPDGLALTATLGEVSATAVDLPPAALPPEMFELRPSRRATRPAPAVRHTTARPAGLSLVVSGARVRAHGDAHAVPVGLAVALSLGTPVATGTHNPTDEELALLVSLAAA